MADWRWVLKEVALALHEEQLAEHGGPAGIRDHSLLEKAIDRPRNIAARSEPDAARIAAAYAFGVARIRPFLDGNKRMAALSALLFLGINDIRFRIGEAELVVMLQSLAADELNEDEVAVWFRQRLG